MYIYEIQWPAYHLFLEHRVQEGLVDHGDRGQHRGSEILPEQVVAVFVGLLLIIIILLFLHFLFSSVLMPHHDER
jgi:hypothetical protein